MRKLWCSPGARGATKSSVSDAVFPCPRWGGAGEWGKVAGVAPKRAKIGQNWWEAESEPLEGEVPSHQPGENFLLPFAVNCKSDWATDGKRWRGAREGGSKEFRQRVLSLWNQSVLVRCMGHLWHSWEAYLGINQERSCCWVAPCCSPCPGGLVWAAHPRQEHREGGAGAWKAAQWNRVCPKAQITLFQVGDQTLWLTPTKITLSCTEDRGIHLV